MILNYQIVVHWIEWRRKKKLSDVFIVPNMAEKNDIVFGKEINFDSIISDDKSYIIFMKTQGKPNLQKKSALNTLKIKGW